MYQRILQEQDPVNSERQGVTNADETMEEFCSDIRRLGKLALRPQCLVVSATPRPLYKILEVNQCEIDPDP
jgi:hypothetical protein